MKPRVEAFLTGLLILFGLACLFVFMLFIIAVFICISPICVLSAITQNLPFWHYFVEMYNGVKSCLVSYAVAGKKGLEYIKKSFIL
ncbi:MAG: hypothetical protein LBM93_09250 [Oscillospiraceae bacterium]|jgi:hypothetical protein|nr:hypothetical protein [Oscillospiraceae bacterium]